MSTQREQPEVIGGTCVKTMGAWCVVRGA